MTTSTLANSWSQILELTRAIEELARQEAWESVVNLTRERHSSVLDHFQTFPVGPETAGFYMEKLHQFLASEERLNLVANAARDNTIKAIQSLNHNRQAINTYQLNDSSLG